MLLAHVEDDGTEIYFKGNSCYYLSVGPIIGGQWCEIDDTAELSHRSICVVNDPQAINNLATNRIQLIEQAAGKGHEVKELVAYLPCTAHDCVGIMQGYLDACRPWPLRPKIDPTALNHHLHFNVQSMTRMNDFDGDEAYTGITFMDFQYIVIRKTRFGAYSWVFKSIPESGQGISYRALAMESIILEARRKQLLAQYFFTTVY